MSERTRSAGRGFLVLASGQVVAKALAFVATVVMTRTLGVERFGIVAWAMTLFAYLVLAVDLGLSALGPFEVARHGSATRDLARIFVGWRAVAAVPAFVLTVAVAMWAPVPRLTSVIVASFAVLLLLQPLDLDWVFQGSRRLAPSALAEVAGQLVLAGGVVFFVHRPEHVLRVPFIYIAARMTTLAIQGVAFRFLWPASGRQNLDRHGLIRAAMPLAGSSVVAMISNNFDLLVLYLMIGARASGLYGAAYRLVWTPTIFVMAYYTVMRPLMARARAESADAARHLLSESTRITVAMGIGLTIGGLILARPLVELLFGAPYAPAVAPARLLFVALGLVIVGRNFRWMLVACHRQRLDLRNMGIAAVVNVVGNVLLIPLLGISGAAAATVVSETVLLAISVLTTLFLWLTRPWNVILRIGVGGILYLACLLAAGVVHRHELRALFGGIDAGWRSNDASS